MQEILLKAKEKHQLEKNEIIELLNSDGKALFKAADDVRKKYVGDAVHLRGLIEYTNICKNSCKYCGIRKDNNNVQRYRLSKDEIIQIAKRGVLNGFKTIVLQGGEDSFFSQSVMCEIISKIKKMDVALTLSLGERSYDDYKAFKEAGADRFLLRIETTDKDLYEAAHPGMSYDVRKKCLYDLKSLGYETGTGCLIGLPGQSIDSLADDILFFKELDADMIGVGPFIPHPQTPYAGCSCGSFDIAIKVMAITRLLLPNINIPATTAMETLNPNGRIVALQCGANVFMPNITACEAQNYEIYPNKAGIDGAKSGIIYEINNNLKLIGRYVSDTKGFKTPLS